MAELGSAVGLVSQDVGGLESAAGGTTRAFPLLDGYRGLAALAVVLTHIGFETGTYQRGVTGAVLARLDFGVTVFFLLSGFLLYRPWARAHLRGERGPALTGYLGRRALRVLPAYWVALAVAWIAVPQTLSRGPAHLAEQALLLQIYRPGELLRDLTQTWSLATEVAFYLLLPLLAAAVASRRRTRPAQLRAEVAGVAVLVATSLAYQIVLRTTHLIDRRVGALWLPQTLGWFALGMGLAVVGADMEHRDRSRLRQLAAAPGTCAAVGLALFALATTPLAGPRGLQPPTAWEALSKNVLYAAAGVALLLPGFLGPADGGTARRWLASAPLRWLGRVSYAVFLFHPLLVHASRLTLGYAEFRGTWWILAAVAVPLTLAAASLSYAVVEAPVLRLKRHTRR